MTDRRTTAERLALLRYRLLLLVAVIPVLLLTLLQAAKHKDGRYLLQRFGMGYRRHRRGGLWIHAASVGEVQALLPLVTHLQRQYPKMQLRLSTVTPTGGKIVRQKLPQVQHLYLPLDLPALVNRFIRALNAPCGLIMETELWPNLYHAAQQKNLRLVTINGRVSAKTLHTPPWVKTLYRLALRNITAVLARSQVDAERFIELGAPPDATTVTGNLKFAIAADFSPPQQALAIDRPYVLAASTHQHEERLLAELWAQLNTDDYLLVIAPRHPYRSAHIVKQLIQIDNHIAVRSKGDPVQATTRVYLADTLGELMVFMRDATVVFMGGSLVPTGGHNILEPAMLGKAIVFGPYMHNFTDEALRFIEQQAAVQVTDADDLLRQLKILLADPAKRHTYGERAKILMEQEKDMVERYVSQLQRYCDFEALNE